MVVARMAVSVDIVVMPVVLKVTTVAVNDVVVIVSSVTSTG